MVPHDLGELQETHNMGRRFLLSAFALMIFLGSVHLAWHYAADSYIAWALTLALWFGRGKYLVSESRGPERSDRTISAQLQ